MESEQKESARRNPTGSGELPATHEKHYCSKDEAGFLRWIVEPLSLSNVEYTSLSHNLRKLLACL